MSFLEIEVNPTETLMEQIQALEFSDIELKAVVLPVEFQNAFKVLKQEILKFKPDLVLSFGVANQRQNLELERIAINFKSSKNEDTSGYRPNDEPILIDGPDGIFSNLNIIQMINQLTVQEIPIAISNSAGTYVCNALMYELCLDAEENKYFAGFIHTPSTWPADKLLTSALKMIESPVTIHTKN